MWQDMGACGRDWRYLVGGQAYGIDGDMWCRCGMACGRVWGHVAGCGGMWQGVGACGRGGGRVWGHRRHTLSHAPTPCHMSPSMP